MGTLINLLEARDADSLTLLADENRALSSDLLSTATAWRKGPLKNVFGQSISLVCRDISTYVHALIALDGWASRLLVVDDSLEDSQLEKFEAKLEAAFRVTTAGDSLKVTQLDRSKQREGTGEVATEWVIPTSGTTGEPKLIAHDLESLTRSVKSPTANSAKICWGLLYSPTRFAGIQVILQALAGGSALAVPSSMSDLRNAVATLSACGCNALSATPSLWRKLAFSGLLASLDLRYVTLGGEAPDQKILDTLREHYPAATIRHIYASTEAGVGFSVSDGRIGFPVEYLQKPPPGVELKLTDQGMLLLRPARQRQKLLSGGDGLVDVDGWITSGDLVELRGDRCYFLGRENGAINVGGQKVHPTAVEAVLLELPEVRAARIFGKPNPILGSLVAAEIVAQPEVDTASLKQRILEHCKGRLERFQIPAMIHFVDDFDLTPAGKVKR